MLDRYDLCVAQPNRVDVKKRDDVLTFVDHMRAYLPLCDQTKNTVRTV